MNNISNIWRTTASRCWRLAVLGVAFSTAPYSFAQETKLKGGFEQTALPVAAGGEISRQPDLWVMEVSYKQMRFKQLEVTDPKTGEKKKELIWYLCWRALNRPLPKREANDETLPVNVPEPLPGPLKFIPQFELTTYNDRKTEIPAQTLLDDIVPEAMAAIQEAETPRPTEPRYRDSLKVIGDVPPVVASDAPEQPWIYGVAVWRKIDPRTRFFKIACKGFSNGYEKRPGPGGESITWRKTLIQKFLRPGDEFDPTEREFVFDGLPVWEHLPSAPVKKLAPAE